jgi:hypothetical protein
MALLHVYDEIRGIEKSKRGDTIIGLADGTEISLPPSAANSVKDLQRGNLVLLDLADWEEKGLAWFHAYQNSAAHLHVTTFGMGCGCSIESPVLK